MNDLMSNLPNGTKKETLGFVSVNLKNFKMKLQTLDPESDKWSCEDVPPPPAKRTNYRAMVIDKKLIIAGGWLGYAKNIVECLDLQTKEWTNLPSMRQARAFPGMAEFNGDLYVVGGLFCGRWLRSVEKYNFRTCEWQELAPMHSNHDYVSVTVLGELLYVGSSSIECFNPAKNEWTQLPHKNETLDYFGLAGVGGHLYAVGGEQNEEPSKTVERFHPSTNTWTVIKPGLRIPLSFLLCVSWNNRLIAYNGNTSPIEYNPEENVWKTLAPLVEYDPIQSICSLFTFTK